MRADQIIIEPVLTEKTNDLRGSDVKKYVFKVHASANKSLVRQSVIELFNVKPTNCHIINVKSKPKSQRTKSGVTTGRKSPWKKAIVTLKKGDTITAFEGV